MEALLIQQKGIFVSPSIVASLSEYCAFLTQEASVHRKTTAKQIKEIYKARSAGTHGGKIQDSPSEEHLALDLCRTLLFKMLELYPDKFKTEAEIANYVEENKFK